MKYDNQETKEFSEQLRIFSKPLLLGLMENFVNSFRRLDEIAVSNSHLVCGWK